MAKNLDNIREVWQRASFSHRAILLTVVLVCVGAAALLVHWARQPDWALLYGGLDPEEAAAIVEKIRDDDTPFKLERGGTTVYVPVDKVYSLRLSMASQGLPSGGHEGYRLLDKQSIGVSPFSQRISATRALSGELARTVEEFDEVMSARVLIARPATALFGGGQKKTKASVALRLKPGHRIGPNTVSAIVHLVAGSVEGLEPGNVVVTDSQEGLLSRQGRDEMGNGGGTYLDYKSRVESYMARKVEDLLAAVLGPDRARVRVDAVIETTRSQTTKETYDPDSTVVTREEITSSSSVSGVPAGGDTTKDDSTVSEYKVSKTIETRSDLPGNVTSLTVAAFVDLTGPPPAADDGAAPTTPPTKLTPEDVEAIIVKAIGITDPTAVKVVPISFHDPSPSAEMTMEEDEGTGLQFYLEIARRGSLGILVIGALIVLKMISGSKKKGAQAVGALDVTAGAENMLPGAAGALSPDALRQRIGYALQENPEAVRRLFLTWAQSEEGER